MKLMFLALAIALVVAMARAFLPKEAPPPEPLRVNVATLAIGGVQGIEWNRQRLLVVHVAEGEHYLAISDYDPVYGCPMLWIPAGSKEALFQPWPGGLRAVCTNHWFDSNGTSLTEDVGDLKRLPFTVEDGRTLVIGAASK